MNEQKVQQGMTKKQEQYLLELVAKKHTNVDSSFEAKVAKMFRSSHLRFSKTITKKNATKLISELKYAVDLFDFVDGLNEDGRLQLLPNRIGRFVHRFFEITDATETAGEIDEILEQQMVNQALEETYHLQS